MNVTLIDHMGSDLSVVNAARVSFDKQSEWVQRPYDDNADSLVLLPDELPAEIEDYEDCPRAFDSKGRELSDFMLSQKDAKLIRYLARHNHWTPFGHCFASFRVKAPIFVARQLGKHQVGLVWNEVSRRYVDSDPEFYVPDAWRKRAENVKQGSSDDPVDDHDYIMRRYEYDILGMAKLYYRSMLENGCCPEQARMILPASLMTEWVWSGSLAAFARVCKLRLDPHTQKETRQVAEMIDAEMARLFPVSWQALMETE